MHIQARRIFGGRVRGLGDRGAAGECHALYPMARPQATIWKHVTHLLLCGAISIPFPINCQPKGCTCSVPIDFYQSITCHPHWDNTALYPPPGWVVASSLCPRLLVLIFIPVITLLCCVSIPLPIDSELLASLDHHLFFSSCSLEVTGPSFNKVLNEQMNE